MTDLNNKIILITGASSGIGLACAKRFAKEGAKLILCARRKERLDQLVDELQHSFKTDCLAISLDIQDKKEVQDRLANLPEPWQAVDVLVNNAGLALTSDPIQQGSLDNWDKMIDTNVKGLLYVTRMILPGMIARQKGYIINLGSIAGYECYVNGNVYCATKFAVRAISQAIRLDLHGSPIRVTELAPGAVETEFSQVRWNDMEKAKSFYKDFDPLFAEDIADAAYFCLTRPAHVNISEMTILPTAQSAATQIDRSGKKS